MQLIFVTLKTAFAKDTTDALTKSIEIYPGLELFDFRIREDKKYFLVKFAGETDKVREVLKKIMVSAPKPDQNKKTNAPTGVPEILTDITFSPISGISLNELEKILKNIAKDLAEIIPRPLYLWRLDDGHNHPEIYETTDKSSGENLKQNPTSGINIRVQKFHLNISFLLRTDNLETVQNISDRIGSQGPVLFNQKGKELKDSSGKVLRGEGMFKNVDTLVLPTSIGKTTQLVCKIKDFENPNLLRLWDYLQEICYQEIVEIVGSSLLGCIPLDAVRACLMSLPASEQKKYDSVREYLPKFVDILGLNKIGEFIPEYQIIDYHFSA